MGRSNRNNDIASFALKISRQSKARRFESLPNNIEGPLNSVRFCRSSDPVTEHDAILVELTVLLSATLNCYFCRWLAGTTLALLLATLKRLASRGGRTRTSTRFPVLGRQFKKGACTSPLFSFLVRSAIPRLVAGIRRHLLRFSVQVVSIEIQIQHPELNLCGITPRRNDAGV